MTSSTISQITIAAKSRLRLDDDGPVSRQPHLAVGRACRMSDGREESRHDLVNLPFDLRDRGEPENDGPSQ